MDLVTHLTDRLLFAVPKKGRLHQQCLDLLLGADIQFHRHNRLDIALVKNHSLALIFLPAADIPRFVAEGDVHLGITGQDQVAEFYLSAEEGHGEIREVLELGFGKCSLKVQVPENGDIHDVEELIGKRIVTSFTGLTKQYFNRLEEKAMTESRTTIKYVGGSVEAACALGVADGIIDIVESGETMKAAGLKAIDTVMESQAVLISSTTSGSLSPKLSQQENGSLQTLITNRIRGVIAAKRFVLLEYNVPRSILSEAIKITPGKRAPTISPLESPGEQWVAVSVMVERKDAAQVMDHLENKGASDILGLVYVWGVEKSQNRGIKDGIGISLEKCLQNRDDDANIY